MSELLVVADLGFLKAYKVICEAVDTTPKLELIETFWTQGHQKISEQVTDEAGRFSGGVRDIKGLRAYGERHNLELELDRRAVKQLAHRIDQLVQENKDCRDWFLVAGMKINQGILQQLDPEVKSRMRANIPEDLTKLNEGELLRHFERKNFKLKCSLRQVLPE